MAEHKPGVAPTDWPTQLQWLHMHFPRVELKLTDGVNPVSLEVWNDRQRVWSRDSTLQITVSAVFGELSRGHFPGVQPDV